MIQNILALIIVFGAAIITVYFLIRSVTSKKPSGCDGCSACEVNDAPTIKRHHQLSKKDFHSLKIVPSK